MLVALIQCRLNSTRLPGKALLPLGGSTVIGKVVKRVQQSCVDKVVVVSQDDEIIDHVLEFGASYSKFITNTRDVLAEFYHAAMLYRADTIVRITGDCPCISPKMIDQMVGFYADCNVDYYCNHSDYIQGVGVDGLDIEIFSYKVLERAFLQATDDYDKEHVCPWMVRNGKVNSAMFYWDFNSKLSIDTQEDYERVSEIFDTLGDSFETKDLETYFKEKENGEEREEGRKSRS